LVLKALKVLHLKVYKALKEHRVVKALRVLHLKVLKVKKE
tara:strand:+ start:104 stop:223 length:120 start_codon:yes stop_codon:yes gene_type:complete